VRLGAPDAPPCHLGLDPAQGAAHRATLQILGNGGQATLYHRAPGAAFGAAMRKEGNMQMRLAVAKKLVASSHPLNACGTAHVELPHADDAHPSPWIQPALQQHAGRDVRATAAREDRRHRCATAEARRSAPPPIRMGAEDGPQ